MNTITDDYASQEKRVSRLFWETVLVIQVALVCLEYFVLSNYPVQIPWLELGKGWTFGWILFLLQIGYSIEGIHQIGPTELGVRLFFRRPINNLYSGFVWIPPIVCGLITETRLTIQDELPSDPENIYHGDEPTTPEGKFPPIRIPFGYPAQDEVNDDPLNVRMTQEVVLIIRWRIVNFRVFISTIGDKDEARRQMEDNSVSILLREFGKITPAKALLNLDAYDGILSNEIRNNILNWGVELDSAKIKLIVLTHAINGAIQEIGEATAKKKARIIEAEGIKRSDQLQGEGKGLAEKGLLDGRTSGLKKMVDDLDVDSKTILGAEVARAVTENPGQKTFIAGSGGFKDIVSVAAVAGEAFGSTNEKGGSENEQ
jgi:hypothetical protein